MFNQIIRRNQSPRCKWMHGVKAFIYGVVLLTQLAGCVYFPPTLPPVRSADFYDFQSTKEELTLACKPYTKESESKLAFGIDLTKARLMPVEIVIFNETAKNFDLSGIKTQLTDSRGHWVKELSALEANNRAKKFVGKRLGAIATAGTLMVFFTLPAKFRGDEGLSMHSEPLQAIKKSKTSVLEAGGQPVLLKGKENVRWFTYYDLSNSGEEITPEFLSEDLYLEISGIREKESGREIHLTVFMPLSEKN